jgi:PAS domain S-box-containing protein
MQPTTMTGPAGETADYYRLDFETIPHIVWAAGPRGDLEFCNSWGCEYFGLSLAQLAEKGWRAVLHAEDLEECLQRWEWALRSGRMFDVGCRLRRADGEYRWHRARALPLRAAGGAVERWFGTCTDVDVQLRAGRLEEAGGEIGWASTSGEPVFDASGEFRGYRGVARDITAQRRAEEALRASEQRFQAYMDHSPAIAWMKDSQLRYRYVSEPFLRQLKKTREQVIGRTVVEIWPDAVAMLESDRIVQKERRPVQLIDSFAMAHDGALHDWLVSKFPLADETGAMGVGGVSLDITERIDAEKEARELLDRLIAAQESERQRLAHELHDLIGQNLTALAISLANLPGDDAQIGRMRRTVEQTIEAIRGVMAGLRPPGLDEYGLLPALHAHAAEFQLRTGLRTSVEVRGFARRLAARVETALFRIVQEALTNAAKHSGAAAVQVLLEEADGALTVQVEDDGRGLVEPAQARRPGEGGWGLRAIRERAQACGGTMRIENAGRGARLVVEIPLHDD